MEEGKNMEYSFYKAVAWVKDSQIWALEMGFNRGVLHSLYVSKLAPTLTHHPIHSFGWSAAMWAGYSMDVLKWRGIAPENVSPICSWCKRKEESINHFFLSCGFSSCVWCRLIYQHPLSGSGKTGGPHHKGHLKHEGKSCWDWWYLQKFCGHIMEKKKVRNF